MNYQQLPVSPVTGRPSSLTAACRRSVGLDRQAQTQAQAPSTIPAQKSLDLGQIVKAAVQPLAAELGALLNAMDPDTARSYYQSPGPQVGMTAGQAARSGVDVRAMSHILAQRSTPVLDAVTAEQMRRQAQADLQNRALHVAKANFATGHESAKPGVSVSPEDNREHMPTIFGGNDHLISI